MTDNTTYLETLLKYYEEEVMGVAYLYGLADHIGGAVEGEKFALLAEVERRAADAVQPLLEKYGLAPRDESLLKALGESHVERHRHYSWMEFMAHILDRYPAYLDDFDGLERLAPGEDKPALQRLTYHEILVIEFAEKEIALDPDSLAPLRTYLDHPMA